MRPVCGLENHVERTLRSTFRLDYPYYEVLFCVANNNDPVVPLTRKLIDDHPQVQARLLIGDDRISANPKLNNCVKGWHAAAHEWVVIADSNVLMPRDYIQRLLSAWQSDTGLVCAPPLGGSAQGFWAELECAFLNPFQARVQYFADTLGIAFAQGKTMLWNRRVLDCAGGIRALAAEIAEDAAATKLVRRQGFRVRLAQLPFEQPLGQRRANDVWARQVRWARLRRTTFPMFFLLEIVAGSAAPLSAIAYLAMAIGWPLVPVTLGFCCAWYGAEYALLRFMGWQVTALYPLQAMMRDALLPALWISGWLDRGFVWRGNTMTVSAQRELVPPSRI